MILMGIYLRSYLEPHPPFAVCSIFSVGMHRIKITWHQATSLINNSSYFFSCSQPFVDMKLLIHASVLNPTYSGQWISSTDPLAMLVLVTVHDYA